MFVEEKNRLHRFCLEDQCKGIVTGICKVVSFDDEEAVILLDGEELIIKGQNLQLTSLVVDKGEIEFSGRVQSFMYRTKKTKQFGIFSRGAK